MTRIYLLAALIVLCSSCSHVFYNRAENVRDEEQAKSLIKGLKNGTLIVQIPCEKQKMQILKSRAEKAEDPKRKDELRKEYEENKTFLKEIQNAMIQAANHEYVFSNFYFLPDSSVVDFKNGVRENIFINENFEYLPKVSIDNDATILFIRGERQYDFLYVYKPDNTYPPDPFPYYSAMFASVFKVKTSHTRDITKVIDWKALFHDAFAQINYKFHSFHDKHF